MQMDLEYGMRAVSVVPHPSSLICGARAEAVASRRGLEPAQTVTVIVWVSSHAGLGRCDPRQSSNRRPPRCMLAGCSYFDTDAKPLTPRRPARSIHARGQAAVFCRYPFTIILKKGLLQWLNSAADTTCPDFSSTKTRPAILFPGSSFSRRSRRPADTRLADVPPRPATGSPQPQDPLTGVTVPKPAPPRRLAAT
jgi:hypothetical protein